VSTKIYTAWRFPVRRLNEFLATAREQWFRIAAAKVKQLAKVIDKDRLVLVKSPHMPERAKRLKLALQEMQVASQSKYRITQVECIDMTLNVWLHNGIAYIIPIGELNFIDTMKFPPWAQDFSYWNNTDRPDNVTPQGWAWRARVWEKVCLQDHDRTRLNHVVVEAAREVGLIEIIRRCGIVGDKSWAILP
jgi:hypothetical protein